MTNTIAATYTRNVVGGTQTGTVQCDPFTGEWNSTTFFRSGRKDVQTFATFAAAHTYMIRRDFRPVN